MADQVTVDNGSGTDYTVSTDDAGASGHVQRVKLAYSADGVATHVTADADGVLVNLGANNDVTVTGTVTANLSATDNTVLDNIDANTDSLAVVGGGTEATALRVTIANNSTGVLSVDDNGATLSVDDGGGALTVDGSVTATLAAADNAVGRVKLTDGTDVADVLDLTNSNPLTVAIVDGSGTQITSFGGSGGTSMTDDAAFTPGSGSITPIGALFDDVTPDSVNEGDGGIVRMSANRNLYVTVRDAAGNERGLNIDSNGALAITAASLPSHAVTNAGTFATQVDGAALTALQLIDDPVFADDAAFTIGTSKVGVAGGVVDETSTDSADEGDAAAIRVSATRQLVTTVRPSSGGEGLDIFRSIDLDETEEEIKASAGKLYGWFIYNDGAAEVYVKLYNATAASVTVGSTTPVMTIPIPAGSGANVEFTNGITFSTAITAAATTGVADSDTAAPAANQVIANFLYK